MRKSLKLFSSLITVVLVISAFSMMVSASSSDRSYWKSLSNDYYYKQMTSGEKKFYDRLDETCMAYLLNDEDIPGECISVDCSDLGLTAEQVDKVQLMFTVSNPQYFFLEPKYKYNDKGIEINVYPDLVNGTKRASVKAEIKSCIDSYIKAASSATLPEEKENIVALKICKEISRDLDPDADKEYYQCIYSAVQGTTKCKGFALFFGAVMNALGIECVTANSEPHAWNYVKLHGYWYCVDVTNMNQEEMTSHGYYNHDGKDIGNAKYSAVDSRLKAYLPVPKYDEVGRNYTSRYFVDNGVTYFIVCDMDDAKYVIAVKDATGTLPAKVKYNGIEYTVMSAAGWARSGKNWVYYNDAGKLVKGWYEIEGEGWYYFDKTTGAMLSNWQQIGGKWYYFGSDGILKTEWQQIGGKWYYFNPDGDMVTGWKLIDGYWYFFNKDGDMAKGWQKISNKWYYFNGGAMVTGWKKIGNVWYFFTTNGDMATGWKSISGKWYYFGSSGEMTTGWKQISGKWYIFNAGGEMATGWKSSGGKWYYMSSSGAMQEGWVKTGGSVYYLVPGAGYMATGEMTIDGTVRNFADGGACTNPPSGI